MPVLTSFLGFAYPGVKLRFRDIASCRLPLIEGPFLGTVCQPAPGNWASMYRSNASLVPAGTWQLLRKPFTMPFHILVCPDRATIPVFI